MNVNQIEVLQWWHGNRDYQTGVMLLTRISKNKVLAQTLMKPGKEKSPKNHDKLHYEVAKAVGLDWKKMPKAPSGSPPPSAGIKEEVSTASVAPKSPKGEASAEKRVPLVSDKPIDQYPKIIRRLKFVYQEKYTERAMLHKKMCAVPDENTPNNMATRAKCLANMKVISKEMDRLYGFIERYEKTGTIPIESEIWPPEKKPEPVKPLSPKELKKRKKNLQSANTKDRNQLLYQQNRKGGKEAAMPDGPKRKRIEMRIKKREEEIEEIEMKLIELEK